MWNFVWKFMFSHRDAQLFPHRLLKRPPFYWVALHLCHKSLGHISVGLFLDSLLFLWSKSTPSPIPYPVHDSRFIIVSKSGFQIVSIIPVSSPFHINFRTSLSVSTKNPAVIFFFFYWNQIKYIDPFGKNSYLYQVEFFHAWTPDVSSFIWVFFESYSSLFVPYSDPTPVWGESCLRFLFLFLGELLYMKPGSAWLKEETLFIITLGQGAETRLYWTNGEVS